VAALMMRMFRAADSCIDPRVAREDTSPHRGASGGMDGRAMAFRTWFEGARGTTDDGGGADRARAGPSLSVNPRELDRQCVEACAQPEPGYGHQRA
jgi:hypothetical protein